MKKERIGILFGGRSGEHEVSLVSAASVMRRLNERRFEAVMIGIDRRGVWYLQENPRVDPGSNGLIMQTEEKRRVCAMPGDGLHCGATKLELSAVFPVLHGTFGEDGTVQGLLEIADIPYVGAGVLGSSLCMDKATVKRVWMQQGLRVVPFELALEHELRNAEGLWNRAALDRIREKTLSRFSYPLFVKPSRAGSSVGVARVEDDRAFEEALADAFRYDVKVLIEPELRGREIECSVIGNEQLEAFIPGEIVPTHGFYDYTAKYVDPEGAKLLVPAPLEESEQEEVKRISTLAYGAAEVEGMARVDCFIEERSGSVYLNEINTIPGFTGISMFSKLCEASGLPYPAMLERIIDLAYARYKRRSSLTYQLLQ